MKTEVGMLVSTVKHRISFLNEVDYEKNSQSLVATVRRLLGSISAASTPQTAAAAPPLPAQNRRQLQLRLRETIEHSQRVFLQRVNAIDAGALLREMAMLPRLCVIGWAPTPAGEEKAKAPEASAAPAGGPRRSYGDGFVRVMCERPDGWHFFSEEQSKLRLGGSKAAGACGLDERRVWRVAAYVDRLMRIVAQRGGAALEVTVTKEVVCAVHGIASAVHSRKSGAQADQVFHEAYLELQDLVGSHVGAEHGGGGGEAILGLQRCRLATGELVWLCGRCSGDRDLKAQVFPSSVGDVAAEAAKRRPGSCAVDSLVGLVSQLAGDVGESDAAPSEAVERRDEREKGREADGPGAVSGTASVTLRNCVDPKQHGLKHRVDVPMCSTCLEKTLQGEKGAGSDNTDGATALETGRSTQSEPAQGRRPKQTRACALQ
jgi:hypothetical protein